MGQQKGRRRRTKGVVNLKYRRVGCMTAYPAVFFMQRNSDFILIRKVKCNSLQKSHEICLEEKAQ